ncbi:MAG TPA: zinc-binding dehydrogenase [Acidimicrobiia bacterium]|nr:zinc-binding dehydrogenase [Acidimicrobiia bacterium]
MRAAIVSEVGVPPRVGETEEPVVEAGKALVEVTAVALNPVELRVAAGRMPQQPQVPYVPGLEGAGTVVRSSRIAPGTRVRFEGDLPGSGVNGVLAEMAAVDEETLVELPVGVPDALAAAAGVVGVTARLALQRAGFVPGESVAVLGATGGVGQMAVQLAKTGGASVVVAVGRDADALELVAGLGAVPVPLDGDLAQRLVSVAGGRLDVVVDMLWGEPAMAAISALAHHGRLVNIGNLAGTDVDLPLASMRQYRSAVIGLSSGWTDIADKVAAYKDVLAGLEAGEMTVEHEVFQLDQVDTAWERQASFPHRRIVVAIR